MADQKNLKTYDEYAKKWAERLRSGENVVHEYLEKPAMYREIPDLTGKDVLCVGCGTGEECRYLKDLGARRVVGIDNSSGLIEYAQKSYSDIEFEVKGMEAIDFPENTFDFVYSSLVMHYASEWTDILRRIKKSLKPGGIFLFSTHHPIKWGSEKRKEKNKFSYLLGYSKWKEDNYEVLGDYLTSRKIDDVWFNELAVTYYHRPLSAILRDIRDSGFKMVDFIEPLPVDEAKTKKPSFHAIHQKIPFIMIFKLQKE